MLGEIFFHIFSYTSNWLISSHHELRTPGCMKVIFPPLTTPYTLRVRAVFSQTRRVASTLSSQVGAINIKQQRNRSFASKPYSRREAIYRLSTDYLY